jgi:ubiquinol-cytochrome c reductase cytochrome c subunit
VSWGVRFARLVPRLGATLLGAGTVALVLVAGPGTLPAAPPALEPLAAQPVPVATEPRDGGAVYQATCAACHGTTGGGRSGDGVTAGPPIRDLPLAYIDQTLRTGRMPISHIPAGVLSHRLDDADREALVEWARDGLSSTGEIPEVGPGDVVSGRTLYIRHCAACHGATGGGGIAGGGTAVPPVVDLDAVAIVESIRVGPFEMPAFGPQVISDQEADDIAAYVVDELSRPTTTPLGLAEISGVTALLLTILVGGALLGTVIVVARLGRLPEEDR